MNFGAGTRSAMLAIIVFLALTAAPASAHNGEVEYIAEVGSYYVEVTDDVAPDAGLFYTLYIRDLGRGLPVDDASVEITARSMATTIGPIAAVRLANAYSVIIPDTGEQEWTIDVRIERQPRAVTTFTHTMEGIGARDQRSWWASTPILILIWSLVPAAIYIFHRAGRAAPDKAATSGGTTR